MEETAVVVAMPAEAMEVEAMAATPVATGAAAAVADADAAELTQLHECHIRCTVERCDRRAN